MHAWHIISFALSQLSPRDHSSFTEVNRHTFASIGEDVGQVDNPRGMCHSTTTPGFIFVCDKKNHRIQEFSLGDVDNPTESGRDRAPHCRVVVQFPDDIEPYGITACGDGSTDFIITHAANSHLDHHRAMRINGVDGKIMWTTHGDALPQFSIPFDVKVLLDGRVVLADCYNNQLHILDPATGEILQQLG